MAAGTEIFFVILFFISIFYNRRFFLRWAPNPSHPQYLWLSTAFFGFYHKFFLEKYRGKRRRFSLFQDGACLWITFFDMINVLKKAPLSAAFSVVYHILKKVTINEKERFGSNLEFRPRPCKK